MDNDKLLFMSSLIREKNTQVMSENLELSQKALKLKKELDQLTEAHLKIQKEKALVEGEYQNELAIWEDTTNHLKKIIAESDAEKKILEKELDKLKGVAERCNRNECMIVELKYGIEKINEERLTEKEAIKEKIENVLEELEQVRNEKEELQSEKLMFENEIKRYKAKIKMLENEIKSLKESLDTNKGEIFSWCVDRSIRRDLLRNKQNRIYTPQSSQNFKDLVVKRPCHT